MESGNSKGGWGSFFEHWGITLLVLAVWFFTWVIFRLFFGGR